MCYALNILIGIQKTKLELNVKQYQNQYIAFNLVISVMEYVTRTKSILKRSVLLEPCIEI